MKTACLAMLVAVLAVWPASVIAQPRYQGRSLPEVLQQLQAKGLRIVYSSEMVTATMRVAVEPRGTNDREKLDEVLAPHGLRVRKGPAGTLLIVRAVEHKAPRKSRAPVAESPAAVYREEIRVEGSQAPRHEAGVASQVVLSRAELFGLRTTVADDPIRGAHLLPHVAAGDDFRSEFSVRGSAYRHIGVVIEGVATRRLQHTAYGRGNTGSLSMLQGDTIGGVSLQAGAYPQRFGSTLGAQLGLTIREGSRQADAFRVAFNASSAAAVGEGPIGGGAGSWVVGLRQSYRNWPTRGLGEFDGTMFGFSDAVAKIVYDVRPRHQVSLTMLGGQSYVDEPDGGALDQPGDGANRTAMINIGLRSTIDSRTVLTQRAYVVGHQFLNKTEAGQRYSDGFERELGYRTELARETAAGSIESGADVQHIRSSTADAWTTAVYAHYRWRPTARALIAPGLRVAHSTFSRGTPVGRWVLGQFSIAPQWTVSASAGVSHQFPFSERAPADVAMLRPERSSHVDVGVSQAMGETYRWQATLYSRRERNILREARAAAGSWENALSGTSQGLELLLERRRTTGISGWLAYSFGKTRYADPVSGEAFWADFDQRHAVNVYGAYRLSPRSTLALTFRGGTNFPIPAYLAAAGGALFAGDRRNEVRLRPYARVDLRASRVFERAGRRFTAYAEVLNVLNRTNLGLANGRFTPTGQAIGFTEPLMPRLPSAGVVVEF